AVELALEVGRGRVRAGWAVEDGDERTVARAEFGGQAVVDGRRFGGRVEPATCAEHRRCLARDGRREDGHDDGDEGDGLPEAIDEGAPAAEHVCVLPGGWR